MNELVSTANVKQLFGCPNGPPDICMLPSMIPAQPVATSVAIGPDGAYYGWLAVELEAEGFTGLIAGGSINACDLSPFACTQFDIDLLLPIAVAVNRSGTVFAAISALIPGEAEVVELP